MKRIYSDEIRQEHKGRSLKSHSQLDNRLIKLPISDFENTNVENTITLFKETVELNDVVIMQPAVFDNKTISELHCDDGKIDKPENITKIGELESNNIEKLSEKKGEMLLEAISSDDDIAMCSDEDGALDSDLSDNFNDCTDNIVKDFVPSLFQATQLRSIQDPSLSLFEYNHRKLGDDSKCEELAELVDCLEVLQSKNIDINEKWIITAERTILILPKALCHILNIPEYCHKLFSLVNITLDFNCASKAYISMSTLIIRHLKVGLQLIEVLCHYNEDLSEHLIKHHQIHNKLINLFYVKHMSLSLKLYILRALDSSLNGSEPIRLFSYTRVFDNLNGYETLLKILSIHQSRRVYFLATSILRKIHFYELLQKLNANINILDSNSELSLQECLAEIATTYIKAPILMGCPKRFLPARAQFELTPALTHFDVYPTIYRLFDDSLLINCIIKLLDKPNSDDSSQKKQDKNILKLLQSLMDCDHGLRYLGSRHKELNELITVLNKVKVQLTLTLIYKVKILALIDYLSYFWECNLMHNFKLDQMESVDILHDIFLLTQSTIGKYAVVNVLTMGDNLNVILNFFKYTEQLRSKNDDLYMLYSLDLLKIVLENSDDVSYLKKYGALIYELACRHNDFNDLIAWTFPAMKHSTFFHDDVSELCNIVKKNINNCSNVNKTLITSLRILKYLGIPNDEITFKGVEDFVELKYKYIILQMYSFDMLGNLLTIIEKMCNDYKQPSINVWKLTGNKAKNMISIIRPSMILIRCMITLLIQSRENKFKDSSPIKILLKLYNLMHCVPDCSIIRDDANKVTKDINKTLEAYIEINYGSSMIHEVIIWSLSSPCFFLPGLLLLCKLLPIPVPIQTTKSLEESVLATTMSFHSMWIDHLSKVNSDLVEFITVLSSSSLLLQPLKHLCLKIANLSLSMCLLVAQSLLNALINTDNNDCISQILNLLTQLCDNKECAIIKTAVLQTLNEENVQENYKKCVENICKNIKLNKQENSILFVQCLCNSDIVLSGSHAKEKIPRDNVPNKWFYNNILNALLSGLFESHTQLSTMSLIIQTCIVIIKNDYGFYQFKMAIDLFPKPFYNIFNNLLQKWNKEDIYCINTLTLTIQLLRFCTEDINTKRVLFINTSQLRAYLNWSNDAKDHPLCLLKEITEKDNSVCHKHLIDLLKCLNDDDQQLIVELIEPQLVTFDCLTTMYKDRLFYTLNENNENYANGSIDLCNNAVEGLTECNIEAIVLDFPDFDIKGKINDLFKIEDCITQPEPIIHKQVSVTTEKKEKTTNRSIITNTHIRHKVFSRLGTIQRPDTFRNRLPNTSRPPSLHVDDFVAMETRNERSTRPPRYKLPIQPIQDLNIRMRERQMAYERTYSLFSPFKSHLSLHNWHAQVNALAHLRADYQQKMNNRHLELQRHSLLAEWRQLRAEAALRKKRTYSRR